VARLMRRSTFVAGAAALGGAASAAPLGAQNIPLTGVANIAVLAPFTGDAIRLGEQLGDGVRSAVDSANQLRGPLDRLYQMRTFDDQNTLASGLVNAQFACDDETIVCVIGHLSGRITEQALQTYVNGHMPVIVPVSTYDRITAHGYPNVLRLPTKDSTEGNLAGSYIAKTAKPKSSLVYYQDGDYGIDVAAGYHDRMLQEKVDSKTLRFSWEKPDFAAVAKVAADTKPDVIYLAGLVHDMGPLVGLLKAGGYKNTLFASQGFFDPQTLDKYKDDVDGIVVSTSMPPLQLAPSDYRIQADFGQRYGPFTPISAFGYGAAQIALGAIKKAGTSDRIAVGRALGFASTFDTVVGTFSFGTTGDPINPNVYLYTVKGDKWSYLQAAHPSSFILK
jgi:branched-chain amino acid transport system substrate-binding protein